jgi:hypothetical protein
MAEYRETSDGTVVKRSSTGTIIGIIVLLVVAVVVILFATGFWSADVKEGSLPEVKVSAKGGELPDVDVHSKELVVGTTTAKVDVPKVETEKKEIQVPVVGVKDDKN